MQVAQAKKARKEDPVGLLDDDSDDEVVVSSLSKEEAAKLAWDTEVSEFIKKFSSHIPSVSDNALQFLRSMDQSGKFPLLCLLARGIMHAQASSGASERVFSQGRRIVTKERLCLTGERIHRLTVEYMRFKISKRGTPSLSVLPEWKEDCYPPTQALDAAVDADGDVPSDKWLAELSEVAANTHGVIDADDE